MEKFDLGDYFNQFSLKIMKGVIPSKHFIGQESAYGTYNHEVFLCAFVPNFNALFDSTNALSSVNATINVEEPRDDLSNTL